MTRLILAFALMLLVSSINAKEGDDHGNHASPQMKAWFDGLASGKGLCCSFADGFRVDDVDWDTQEVCDGNMRGGSGNSQQALCQHLYRVRINGEWVIVPPNALVTAPNKYGQAVVWPYKGSLGETQIRCFMPGAGT